MASLKKYSKQYDEADAQLSQQADSAQVAERAALMDGWLAWLRAKRQAVDSDEYRDALAALVGPPPLAAALAAASESVQVEEVIDIREEIISFAPQQQQQQQ